MSVSIFLIFQKVEIADLVGDGTNWQAAIAAAAVLRSDTAAGEVQVISERV